ncbi:hypothetical protein RUM43_003243 [Polyplax serrata]|uniref:Uncharacterized protein n=1 Tax=Polyplax serrata TaxID=468196 RepID=A0AAN8PH53_POLSC
MPIKYWPRYRGICDSSPRVGLRLGVVDFSVVPDCILRECAILRSSGGNSGQAERDGLAEARKELERKLETRELELHEKEEELFLQLEKVVRLEEDCEKRTQMSCE